ncbi:MAG: preprotein translocase subunit SecD [Christensenellales bacterium]|jgi:protein-export membrane protein SecD
MTKRRSRRRFIFMSVILLLGLVLSFVGFDIPFTTQRYNGFFNAIPLGFDLQGGASVVFEASLPDDDLDGSLELGIQGTISRIQLLLEEKGYTEHYVYKQGKNRIVVEVPVLTDTDYLLEKLEQPASFKMTTVEDHKAEARISGKHIKNAGYQVQAGQDGKPQNGVGIAFNEEGKKEFARLTGEVAENNGTIYIYVGEDTQPLRKLTASAAITNGYVFISGENQTEEDARDMALKILSGSFSTKLKLIENKIISGSFGSDVLLFGTIAMFASLLLSMLILIFSYKDFGLLASFSTIFFMVLTLFFLQSVPFVRLSVASFAGLIVGILLSLISYVTIYSKIKQENNSGKKLHLSVKNGQRQSLGRVLDMHAVMIIISIIASFVGGSIVKGFGVALLISSVVSMFTSLVLFRGLLKAYLPLNSTNVTKFNLKKVEVKLND